MGYDYTIGPRTVHAWFPAGPVFRWYTKISCQTWYCPFARRAGRLSL